MNEYNNTQTIWARVGVSISVTPGSQEAWLDNPGAMFDEAVKLGNVRLDGETYFPEEASENIDFFGETFEEIGWS